LSSIGCESEQEKEYSQQIPYAFQINKAHLKKTIVIKDIDKTQDFLLGKFVLSNNSFQRFCRKNETMSLESIKIIFSYLVAESKFNKLKSSGRNKKDNNFIDEIGLKTIYLKIGDEIFYPQVEKREGNCPNDCYKYDDHFLLFIIDSKVNKTSTEVEIYTKSLVKKGKQMSQGSITLDSTTFRIKDDEGEEIKINNFKKTKDNFIHLWLK
jgi:hypothetical protein